MDKILKNLTNILSQNTSARKQWEDITPLARRDFLSWILSTHNEETRMKRMKKSCSILAQGKRRPCCFSLVPLELTRTLSHNSKAYTQWKKLTADERRDFIDYIYTEEPQKREIVVEKVCSLLVHGQRRP